jgi:hypothetical protein
VIFADVSIDAGYGITRKPYPADPLPGGLAL